jgi:hypothetical protein
MVSLKVTVRTTTGLIKVAFENSLMLFVYCISILEAPRPGRQTKQDFF